MSSFTTSRKRRMTEDEHNEESISKRPRIGATQINLGEEVKDPNMKQQSKNSTKSEKGTKRLADDDNDFKKSPVKRQRKDFNARSSVTTTTTSTAQQSKIPELAKSSKRRFDDEYDGLERSPLKRQRSNPSISGSATNTSANEQSSLPKFMQLPKFTKMSKRRANEYDETELEGPTAKHQNKDSTNSASVTRQSAATTSDKSTKRGVDDYNEFEKPSTKRQSMVAAVPNPKKNIDARRQSLPKLSQKNTGTRQSGKKRKSQDAPAGGGRGKRQRIVSTQPEAISECSKPEVPPKSFLERFPREVSLYFLR